MVNCLGKLFFFAAPFCVLVLIYGCATSRPTTPRRPQVPDMAGEVSLKQDSQALAELRKDVPLETKRVNDRLKEVLGLWSESNVEPEKLRNKYDDEIRKMRAENDRKFQKAREDFRRYQEKKRKEFFDDQKKSREGFFSTKPSTTDRQNFMNEAGQDRDRFMADSRQEYYDFDGEMKDQRKILDDYFKARQSEFQQEYPQYVKRWKEKQLKIDEERKLETMKRQGKIGPEGNDVNKGADGWPVTDPKELEELGR